MTWSDDHWRVNAQRMRACLRCCARCTGDVVSRRIIKRAEPAYDGFLAHKGVDQTSDLGIGYDIMQI